MALGGISRFTFQMDNAGLSHQQLMNAIRLIGEEISLFGRIAAIADVFDGSLNSAVFLHSQFSLFS